MSPQKQRIAIAKACGWKDCDINWLQKPALLLGSKPTFSNGKIISYLVDQRIPHYLADKNAMHEVKQTLWDKGFMLEFVNLLVVITCYAKGISWSKVTTDDRQMLIANATAEQESEAFLKVSGLWQEEQVHEPSFHSYYREDAE